MLDQTHGSAFHALAMEETFQIEAKLLPRSSSLTDGVVVDVAAARTRVASLPPMMGRRSTPSHNSSTSSNRRLLDVARLILSEQL